MSGSPELSVVIPAYFSHETIGPCLEALAGQTFRDFEVIVVESSPDERSEAIVRERFPSVVFIRSAERLLPHAARNRGALVARGSVLVFTDPDCVASPDWLERLADAHHAGHEAVGGAIGNAGAQAGGAVHMVKYAWWLPGGRPGPHLDMPSANASYSRALWAAVGPFLETRFAGDTDLAWRVRASGHDLWYEPGAIVTHVYERADRSFLRERFRRGRDFGLTRVNRRRWSRGRCLAYILASPLLPLMMTVRAARFAFASGHAGTWFVTAPFQLLANGAWCAGEARSHWETAWRS